MGELQVSDKVVFIVIQITELREAYPLLQTVFRPRCFSESPSLPRKLEMQLLSQLACQLSCQLANWVAVLAMQPRRLGRMDVFIPLAIHVGVHISFLFLAIYLYTYGLKRGLMLFAAEPGQLTSYQYWIKSKTLACQPNASCLCQISLFLSTVSRKLPRLIVLNLSTSPKSQSDNVYFRFSHLSASI